MTRPRPRSCPVTGIKREDEVLRRTLKVLVATCLAVSLLAGTALAALPLIVGTNSGERITGTNHAEEIRGLGGSDEISDGFGTDLLYGGRGGISLSAQVATPSGIASMAGVARTSSRRGMSPPSKTS